MQEQERPSKRPAATERPELDSRFREVMNAAPTMVWVADPNNRGTWFNRLWLDFTGLSLDDVGHAWAEGVHPEDREAWADTYARHFQHGQPFRRQFRLRRRDGTYRWVDDSGVPQQASDGSLIGFTGSCVDIHENRETEHSLHRQKEALERRVTERTAELRLEEQGREEAEGVAHLTEQQFRILVQGVKDYALYMLDPRGHVSSWNSGAQQIKGYAAEEVLGQHFSRFYTEEDRADGLPARALKKAATEGKFEAEGWRVRKDGTRFWASVVIDPLVDPDGKLIGFAKITRDITERRQAQKLLEEARERLMQMQKMEAIGQLTGGVAHDFNNLLMIIIGNLETAQRRLGGVPPAAAPQLERAISAAMRGAQRAATLTQRLLAFSRRQPLSPKALDVNRFITAAADFLHRSLGETVEVETVGGAGVWPVEADPSQLEAALLNLAVNARDAMPQGGKLTIETSNAYLDRDYCRANPEVSPGQYVLIAVTDTGAGMSREVAGRAFEPFFTTKDVGQGTGLGLSQVYGFVKQSGGHIKIYTEVNEGTTIKLYLPRMLRETEIHDDMERPERSAEALPDETILIVEDDPDVRGYLVQALRDLDYRVMSAPDAGAALALVNDDERRIDLLLTDVVLPGMNGRELANRMLDLRPELKVLFMTGYSRNAIVHQGRLDRGVELVQKPVTQAELGGRIRDILDAARPR
jgi:PAS domain S-box-containing protein